MLRGDSFCFLFGSFVSAKDTQIPELTGEFLQIVDLSHNLYAIQAEFIKKKQVADLKNHIASLGSDFVAAWKKAKKDVLSDLQVLRALKTIVSYYNNAKTDAEKESAKAKIFEQIKAALGYFDIEDQYKVKKLGVITETVLGALNDFKARNDLDKMAKIEFVKVLFFYIGLKMDDKLCSEIKQFLSSSQGADTI